MKTTIPIKIVPIEEDGCHLKIEIIINGISAYLILDTGASRTVFDEKRIATFVNSNHIEEIDHLSAGLGTNTMKSKKVIIKKIELGEIEITNYEAEILDLSHVNESFKKLELPPIDGVLGGDILNDYKAVIDYKQRELRLELYS